MFLACSGCISCIEAISAVQVSLAPSCLYLLPDSAGEMCSLEYEAVPENYASAFVLNWYQSAALKHSLPTKEAYVTVTR